MQELGKADIGKLFYFLEPVEISGKITPIIYYGELRGIIPKYQFLDGYNSQYKRDQNILFTVKGLSSEILTKSTTTFEVIYNTLQEAVKANTQTPLLHYSVLLKLQEGAKDCI